MAQVNQKNGCYRCDITEESSTRKLYKSTCTTFLSVSGCIHIDTSPSTSSSSGYSKHEFACISMTAVHINTSPSASPGSCDFYSYE